jgi:hypothetical protein
MHRFFPALLFLAGSLPAADGGKSITISEGNRILPQLVFGRLWKTTVHLVNMDAFSAQVPVEFFDDSGAPLRVPLVGVGLVDKITVNVPGNGELVLETSSDVNEEFVQGWGRFILPVVPKVGGLAILRQRVAGRPDYEAAIPLSADTAYRSVMVFDNSAGYTTAVAVVNPRDAGLVDVTVTFRDASGNVIGNDAFQLAPRRHMTYTLPGRISSVGGLKGVAEFRSVGAGGFSYMGLLFNSSGPFTTMFTMEP